MSNGQLARRIEAIREELKQPIPDPLTEKEKKMAERKKAPAKKKRKAKAAAKKSVSDDNVVTLADIADEAGISSQQARQKLRNAEIERPDGKRWGWSPKSKALTQARKALGL